MDWNLDNVINLAITAVVGIILFCVFVIPVSVGIIDSNLTGELAEYAPMITIVITVAIVGLIVSVIRYFGGKSRQ